MKKRYLILLHSVLLLLSVGGVFSKRAAAEYILSITWIKYYLVVLIILFIYAIAWQQIIKRMSIVTAYVNKAITIVWGIVFGYIVFGEDITITKILGTLIILFGVYLVVSDGTFSDR